MVFCSIPARVSAIAGVLALLTLSAAPAAVGRPAAAAVVTQDRLEPREAAADTPFSAQLTLHSSACFTASVIGVGVRDAAGNNLDFPGGLTNQEVCRKQVVLTTGLRSLPAGEYRMFGYYQSSDGAWHNLPEHLLFVGMRVTQDRLSPRDALADTPFSAQLTLHSSACFTASVIGVGVRDAAGNNLDFPGGLTNQEVCRKQVVLTTGLRSLPAGEYRMFGYYQGLDGAWHNLPEQELSITPGSVTNPSSPIPGSKLIWSDEFDGPLSSSRWEKAKSSAYKYGNYNPDDDKLDRIDPADVTVADGMATFTAQPSTFTLPSGHKAWNTGLITTENTPENFMVRTGDYAETRVRMPEGLGAWPALWTWHEGGNEIDSFEYHPDNPSLLELTNHVVPAQKYWNDKTVVRPGDWVTIGTHYGADSVGWYVNGVNVFEDHKGVGVNWSAFLILNLSLCSGDYHPAPSGGPISFAADYVRVYR